MPELPEVETMRRGILSAVGSRVVAIDACPCPRKPILIRPALPSLRKRIVGRQVTAVDRIGKRVAVRLESGDTLVFEPRMTGLVLVSDPPSIEHLRVKLTLRGGPLKEIWYWDRRGLGNVRLLSPRECESQLGGDRLGPDALSLSAEQLQTRFAASRRAIKVALLDQKAVAGIGNLYASEILHLAKIHPAKRCDLLNATHWQRIHAAMLEVLHDAIRHEGSTLSDGTYRNVLNDPGGYQNCHRVYDRAGELCPTCRAASIRRIVQAQRSTFFCPQCQTKRS